MNVEANYKPIQYLKVNLRRREKIDKQIDRSTSFNRNCMVFAVAHHLLLLLLLADSVVVASVCNKMLLTF